MDYLAGFITVGLLLLAFLAVVDANKGPYQ